MPVCCGATLPCYKKAGEKGFRKEGRPAGNHAIKKGRKTEKKRLLRKRQKSSTPAYYKKAGERDERKAGRLAGSHVITKKRIVDKRRL